MSAWIAVCVVVVVAGLFILPKVVDWGPYKARLAAFLTEAIGRDVGLDGPLDITLLPQPVLVAQRLRVGNAPGALAPDMLEARQLTVTLSWRAILQGRIGLQRVVVLEPRLVLPREPGQGPNWRLPVADGSAPSVPAISIARLEIRGGRIVDAIGLSGQPLDARAIDLSGSFDGTAGRLALDGTAVLNGVPVSFALGLRLAETAEAPVRLGLGVPGGRLVFAGWPGERTAGDPLRGRLSVEAEFLPEFVEAITSASGRRPMRVNEAIARRLTASTDLALAGDRLSLDDLDIQLGDERIRGSLLIDGGGTTTVSGRLASPQLDADRWLERLQGGSLFVEPTGAAARAALQTGRPDDELSSLEVRLTCEVGALRYRRDTVRDLETSFRYRDDVLHVLALRAVLPGDFRVNRKAGFEGDAREAGYDGLIEVEGRDLRRTLKWIGIDTSSLPPDRLQTLRIAGRTRPAKGVVHVSDATFELDDQRGTATADIAYSIPTVITARIHLPDLNLDAYQLTGAALQGLMPAPDATPASPPPADEPPPPVLNFAARFDHVLYRGETARDVDAHVVIRGNELRLKHVGVGELLGSHIELSGAIADYGTVPRFDLHWRGVLRDADRMLDFAALPRFVHGRIGAAQVAGRAVGTLKEAALSDLSVSMLGATFTAAGRMSFDGDRRFDFPRFSVAGLELGAFLAAAGGGPREELADVEADGAFHGDSSHATFRGTLAIDGMALSGEFSSTLTARPHVVASLRAPGGLRLDRWLPAAPRSGAGSAGYSRGGTSRATGSSGLTDALSTLDATLTLATPNVAWGSYALGMVELSARLERGVLDVTRLSGTLEGAAFDLTARVDARAATPAIEVAGSVRNIDISRTIAVAGAANEFGTDQLAVALNGTLDVEEMVWRGEGGTLDELFVSAVGRGRSRGEVRASVVRGSASFASFATGLASLFSTQMGFTSAVIDGFVGSWIETRGAFALEGGILAFDEHTAKAPHATAYVKSRFDLRQGTVDTLIALDTGTPGSVDYVMSVQGPLSSPTLRSLPAPER
ncbi:AsmA family protein [Reyranella aquatilis]|uniref:AsmA family protein n=1 Tax=Reyranella aquatilis TaxID=2035356 RepID=A0ABS8KUU7_9HYPH|nr:AsmA family protein [Reyranella aquatilis]MCC8429862.1 AsmA family protein [Reyranella aquatilis]